VILASELLFNKAWLKEENSIEKFINALEEKNSKTAVKGIKIGISDLLAMTSQMQSAEIRKIDDFLASEGSPTLTVMRARHWKKYRSILKRDRIKSDEEYFIIKSICEDTEEGTQVERDAMLAMISAYENT
jgi:hypothetical protein